MVQRRGVVRSQLVKEGTREWMPLGQVYCGQLVRAHGLCGLHSCLSPGLPLNMVVCGQLPPSLVGRELLETGVIGKQKSAAQPPPEAPGLGAGAVPAAVPRQSAGLWVCAGAGSHRAESGIARVTCVLTAGDQLRSEKKANSGALAPLVFQPHALEPRATRIAL